MWSWVRIMNTAMIMISAGTAVPTILPVGVSPIVLATRPAGRAGDGAGDHEDENGDDDVR